jgi:uncharacterized protein (TIGR02996 family)
MTHDDAFMQDIAEHPDDDTPRLIYADWLMEQPDAARQARGEFIRVQCELARAAESDPRRTDLQRRERALWKQYRKRWLPPHLAWVRKCLFRRGCIEEVGVRVRDLTKHGPSLAFLPLVRRASVTGAHRPGVDVAGAFRALARLPRLEAIDLSDNGLDREDVRALVAARLPPRVTALDLRRNALGGDHYATASACVPLLAGWPSLAQLTTLCLAAAQLDRFDARALAASPYLSRLEWFDLSRNATEPKLRWDSYMGPTPTYDEEHPFDAATEALARARNLPRLATLILAENFLGDKGAFALAESPQFQRLHLLDVSGNSFSPLGRARLQSRFGRRVRL